MKKKLNSILTAILIHIRAFFRNSKNEALHGILSFLSVSSVKSLIALLALLVLSYSSHGQAEGSDDSTGENADKLAAELANPNATRGQLFNLIDYVRYDGDIPAAGEGKNAFVYSLQPSLPIPLSEGVNLFVRPLIPIYLSQPVLNETGFQQKAALGNISADVAIGKNWKGGWMTLVGIFGGFPTSTNKELRSNFTTLGPEVVLGKVFKWGFLGALVSHAWSVGNSNDADDQSFTTLPDSFWSTTGGRTSASITAGQYFYTVNLGNAWQITAAPTWSFNHNAEEGEQLIFPIGTGAAKTIIFGNLPIRFGVQYWYYAGSPDSFGPRQQIRLQINPVVPLPW